MSTSPARPLRLTADWLITMNGPAIRNGGVLIDASGRIVAVGPATSLPTPEWAPHFHAPGVALPGLINTHTHLELTGITNETPAASFAAWIRELRERKQARSRAEFRDAAIRGVQAAFESGVTTVADTGDSATVLGALRELGGSGIVYQEVFGPDPAQLEESLTALEETLAELRRHETERARLGVSPHAPYTVSAPLYAAVAGLAARERLPIAIHIAESAAETQLVTRGTGPFADGWRSRSIPDLELQAAGLPPHARRSPVAWVDSLGVLGSRTLCIHAIELDDADIEVLHARDVGVAHCPVSNRRHGHRDAPLAALLAAGVRVGIGTDSDVSVGRMDLFAELRMAAEIGCLTAGQVLELATTGAAAALGLEADIGRLGVGRYGDVTAIAGEIGLSESPEDAVLRAVPDDVLATVVAGRVVHGRHGTA